jgi:hypothetical protein
MGLCQIPQTISYVLRADQQSQYYRQGANLFHSFIQSHNTVLSWFTSSWATSTNIWPSGFYYSIERCHFTRGYSLSPSSFNRLLGPYEADWITPGSSSCDLTLGIESLMPSLDHQLNDLHIPYNYLPLYLSPSLDI